MKYHRSWTFALVQKDSFLFMEIFHVSSISLLLIFLATGAFVCHGNAQMMNCKRSDREALMDFKKGLDDSENWLSSWKRSNCCQWRGIACDNSTGAVVMVDLHNPGYSSSGRYGSGGLSGEIRPSLTKLKSLRHLDLSFNAFNGTIPDFISTFENLQHLNLSNAGFSGAFPADFRNLSNLQVLDVSSNFLGLTFNNLEWLTGLVSLKYLEMTGANLSAVGVGWDGALNKLPFLTELHLSACSLSSFTSSLTFVNFTSLAVIDLSYNSFNSKLPSWLANISSLVSIDVSSSDLYGRIPLGFSELPKLQSLKLDDNDNLTVSCSQLFRGSWEKIEVLNFASNKLHGRLPASLGNMTSLIYLDLFHNDVYGTIPSSFGNLCNLQYVDLSSNKLSGSLPEFLQGTENCPSKDPLPSLQNLIASDNQLAGNLPSWLGQLKNLVVLNLQWNSLQGPIPTSIGALQHLSELRLEANKLNGTLPDSLGQLSELTVLDVSINQLTGFISEEHFTRLSKLTILIVSANSFILNVSSSWVPPFQVYFLDIGSCHLGLSFPIWLKSQKSLNFLDFSNASISGKIPEWLWDMSGNLSLLNVSFNHLEGHLPNPLSIAPSAALDLSSNLFEGPIPLPNVGVVLLDLSNNKFSGPIPNSIGQIMPYLVYLSLSNNHLIGAIPDSMGRLSRLEVADLAGNSLTERIPPSLGNCSSLQVLDLRKNNLFGLIPGSLGQLNLLQALHLSHNRFSGEISSSLQNLTILETLDFGNNRLTGSIPPWIGGGFSKLRILSLRSNSFSGELPSALSNLSSLQVMDLADNKLNGIIPASFGDLQAMARLHEINHFLFYGEFRTQYYEENLVVAINGQLQKYSKTLSLLTCIDISRNNLYGALPEELTKLVGLMVLNLSKNQISGQIPQGISQLHELLSLDLSGNKLTGPIPPSMSSLSFLGYLNLSNNNLSGTIPYIGHMTTFDASSFARNQGLCGLPLDVKCPTNDSHDRGILEADNGRDFIDKWFYLSVGLGFAVGLLLPYFIFAIRRSWSDACFGFVDKIVEKVSS